MFTPSEGVHFSEMVHTMPTDKSAKYLATVGALFSSYL